MLKVSDEENLLKLLLVYSMSQEISRSELYYPLKQILSTVIKKVQKQKIREVILQ